MRIAVDAMGGDYAPAEIIKGALQSLELSDQMQLILVGQEKEIKNNLPETLPKDKISIWHCEEVIGMDEHPATAYRKKKDASITVATKLVKDGQADAVVSAGSTGAQMVAALFGLGGLEGIDRPAIGTILPTLQGPKLLLDAGANADCAPQNLVQFAKMGQVYMETIFQVKTPKIGLVSIGEEPAKGNELTIKTHELLAKEKGLNFIGNIEGRDIIAGKAEVMVCDGFVGNTILKVTEGTAGAIFTLLKEELNKSLTSKLGAMLMMKSLKTLKGRLDYAEYGGAPLLGVKGISIICHGSSKAWAIRNAVRIALECRRNDFIGHLAERVKNKESDNE